MQTKTLYNYDDVISLYGNHQAAAQAFGCDPANLGHWKRSGKVPAHKQLELAHILDNDRAMKQQLARARRSRTMKSRRVVR